jgi:hypothetical protein
MHRFKKYEMVCILNYENIETILGVFLLEAIRQEFRGKNTGNQAMRIGSHHNTERLFDGFQAIQILRLLLQLTLEKWRTRP